MKILLRRIFNIRCEKRPKETTEPLHPSILSGDTDGLRRQINQMITQESDLNDLLVQSLNYADQPEIVYLLLKAGADPLAKINEAPKKRIYDIAIEKNRSAALLEIMRADDAIVIKDGFTECQSFYGLRKAIKHATPENFSNIVDKATAQNYPLTLMAAFSCLKYKKFFYNNFQFTKQQAGDAVAVMIANGFNTVAFDMMAAGFNIKDGTLYKNTSSIRCLDAQSRKNLEDCITGALHPPRVVTKNEKIRELRLISCHARLSYLPYSLHP